MENVKGRIDEGLVVRHCGKDYILFSQLVAELMAYTMRDSISKASDIKQRLQTMQKRYNSPSIAALLDANTRARHLGYSLLYSPAKLLPYLRRLV
jgi:hypothetical protein